MSRFLIPILMAFLSFQASSADIDAMCGQRGDSACYGHCSVKHPQGTGLKECVKDCQQNGVRCDQPAGRGQGGAEEGKTDEARAKQCVHHHNAECLQRCRGKSSDARDACREECRDKTEATCGARS